MSLTRWLEQRQIAAYLAALLLGAWLGSAAPATAPALELAIYPVLGIMLYATFLQVPFAALTRAFRDVRFLSAALTINFAVVPLIVAAFTLMVPLPRAVLLGVLLVLLTPCIDYVIVFSGLAGAASERLLAATPLLMLAQLLALPVFLLLFLGPGLADIVEIGPFLEAFLILIVVPLGLAWTTETLAAHSRTAQTLSSAMTTALPTLMAATLLVVTASQVPKISPQLDRVAAVVPLYVTFLAVMAGAGMLLARAFRLDVARSRAVIFTGATRNSLVMLPLALALPERYAITPVIVVTQTFVELVGMVVYIRAVPCLVPSR